MLKIRVDLDSLFISLPRRFFLSFLLVNVSQRVMKRGAVRMQFYGDFEQGQRVDQREAGILQQHSRAVAQVLPECLHNSSKRRCQMSDVRERALPPLFY